MISLPFVSSLYPVTAMTDFSSRSASGGRHFLQVPGPTNVPDRVLTAMSMPTIDHRGPKFAELTLDLVPRVRRLFNASGPVAMYPGSGSGAWEAGLVNALSPGDRVLMFDSGMFAALWRGIAGRFGLEIELVECDWRKGVDPDQVESALRADRSQRLKSVMVVHNETSTGFTNSIADVRAAMDAAGHPALLMVDSVSSAGSIEYRQDDWRVDVTVAGSQKGLMLPPGLSFNVISEKALAASATATIARSYWSWADAVPSNDTGYFPYTPPTNLLYGLKESLTMMDEEGLDNVYARHSRLAEATRRAVAVWGVENYCVIPEKSSDSHHRRARARGHQRRRSPSRHPGEFRHVAWNGAGTGDREGVPYRPPGPFQRTHAGGDTVRSGDGAGACGNSRLFGRCYRGA